MQWASGTWSFSLRWSCGAGEGGNHDGCDAELRAAIERERRRACRRRAGHLAAAAAGLDTARGFGCHPVACPRRRRAGLPPSSTASRGRPARPAARFLGLAAARIPAARGIPALQHRRARDPAIRGAGAHAGGGPRSGDPRRDAAQHPPRSGARGRGAFRRRGAGRDRADAQRHRSDERRGARARLAPRRRDRDDDPRAPGRRRAMGGAGAGTRHRAALFEPRFDPARTRSPSGIGPGRRPAASSCRTFWPRSAPRCRSGSWRRSAPARHVVRRRRRPGRRHPAARRAPTRRRLAIWRAVTNGCSGPVETGFLYVRRSACPALAHLRSRVPTPPTRAARSLPRVRLAVPRARPAVSNTAPGVRSRRRGSPRRIDWQAAIGFDLASRARSVPWRSVFAAAIDVLPGVEVLTPRAPLQSVPIVTFRITRRPNTQVVEWLQTKLGMRVRPVGELGLECGAGLIPPGEPAPGRRLARRGGARPRRLSGRPEAATESAAAAP